MRAEKKWVLRREFSKLESRNIMLSQFFLRVHWNIVSYIYVTIRFGWLVGWLECCMLAGTDLWKRMPLKCSIPIVFTCPLLSWCTISSLFRENNKVVVFRFPFHIFMPLAKFVVHRFSRIVSYPKDKKFPWPLSAHLPSGKTVGSW